MFGDLDGLLATSDVAAYPIDEAIRIGCTSVSIVREQGIERS